MRAFQLKEIFEDCQSFVDLKTLTTVKTGGVAEILFRPQDVAQLQRALAFAVESGLSFFVLGEGSNCLASDDGYSGVLLKLSPYFCQISFEDGLVVAGAGAKTAMLAAFCLKYQLSGAEFMASIPASVGGATVMNAGCYGQCVADCVEKVKAVNYQGEKIFDKSEIAFGNRESVFLKNDYVITQVYFKFRPKPREAILQKMKSIALAKKSSQPLTKLSFGSVFKGCPSAPFAPAQMIDELGFKGFCFNGAKVSEKHAGFFINEKNATTNDFLMLIDIVGQKVLDSYGVLLVPEVRYLGDKDDLGRLSYTYNL